MPTRSAQPPINLLNNSTQSQLNPNNIQIELSSDSDEETIESRDRRRRREDTFRNKRQGNNSGRQTTQIRPVTSTQGESEPAEAVNHENSASQAASSQQHSSSV